MGVAAIEKALEEESKKTTPKGDATGKTTPAKTTAAGETTTKKKSENEMKLEELSKQKEEKASAVKESAAKEEAAEKAENTADAITKKIGELSNSRVARQMMMTRQHWQQPKRLS